MKAIPASEIVRVVPSVLAPAGTGLALNSVFISEDAAIPFNTVMQFPNAQAVSNFFGPTSPEAVMAEIYFGGFEGCTILPTTIYFTRYLAADASAYLRSGSFSGVSLTTLQSISGLLTITVDGTPVTSSSFNLSSATSFSNAASIINTAFSGSVVVAYDAQRAGFTFTSTTTGTSSTITFATNTAATALKLTSATGAVLSQGGAASTPASVLNNVVLQTQNWAVFTTTFEPLVAVKVAFAEWANTSNDRYVYCGWDTDTSPTTSPDAAASFGQLTLTFDGRVAVWGDTADNASALAAFFCGATASINFLQTQGRITFAGKRQAGLAVTVTDATVAQNLIANGYNFYGNYATANDQFQWLQNGQISGDWLWADEYLNQIKLNSDLQLAFMTLIQNTNAIPYNARGYNLLRSAASDPINAALNFGSIQPGVQLSASQLAEIDTAAGVSGVGRAVSQVGYYLQIQPADPSVRVARGSPPMSLWYASGGSIQKIDMASVDVL